MNQSSRLFDSSRSSCPYRVQALPEVRERFAELGYGEEQLQAVLGWIQDIPRSGEKEGEGGKARKGNQGHPGSMGEVLLLLMRFFGLYGYVRTEVEEEPKWQEPAEFVGLSTRFYSHSAKS